MISPLQRIVFFIFAGRQVNMEVQMPYLDRLLDRYPEAELHLWDLTRDPVDQKYLRTLEGAHDGRVTVLGHLHSGHPIPCRYPNGAKRRRGFPPCSCMKHKPPYEQPYKWYAARFGKFDSAIFVKLDDDVLFLETERFDDLIAPLAQHPERVISANVINNAVCAKYAYNALDTANMFGVGHPEPPANDKRWWALHENPAFAQWCHGTFLNRMETERTPDIVIPDYVRTRPGEAVSINCIAFTHQTMVKLAGMMSDRLGDEGAVDRLLPWICLSFRAAHLTFGPQDAALSDVDLLMLRAEYAALSKEYLA